MSAPRGTPTRSSSEGGGAPLPNLPPSRTRAKPALEAVDLLLCRSALWEALVLGFCPPTEETVARLARAEGAGALAAAAAALDAAGGAALAPPGRGRGVGRVVRALAVAPAPSGAALGLAYGRLFGHTARGEASPYETEYGEDSLWAPQREMSDLGAFYRAFGLALDPGARERPDHVACECEFLLVLARREARACALGDASMRDEACHATQIFLREHLGHWALALGGALARLDPGGFYGALGRLLLGRGVAG